MPSRGRLAKILPGLVVSAALLVYFFWGVDLGAIGAHLGRTRWDFLLVSSGLNLLSLWVRAWRWGYLFPPDARPSHLYRATMIGYMGNNLLPLRAGEILRAYVASRRGQRFWTTLATLVVERVLDGLAVGLIVAVLVLVVPFPAEIKWSALVFLSADLVAMAVLVVVAIAPGACRGIIELLFHRLRWLERRLLDVLGTLTEGLRGVRAGHHVVPIALSSAAIWLLLALSMWTALHAAHLDLPLTAAWTVLAFMGLGVSLPSSPGFVGIIQAATVLALALFAVPRTEALSFSLLIHASQFVPVTGLGLLCLLLEHVSLTEAARAGSTPVAPSRS